ncbi:hypothetical protein BaRGS_00038290 [Batillaria attramentaria]|uniref:Ig-like domain-containing protein n=1 Tax=Batillaria attramentaria TaxID=370345 RepID=A0ABD0J6H8_9CAEN
MKDKDNSWNISFLNQLSPIPQPKGAARDKRRMAMRGSFSQTPPFLQAMSVVSPLNGHSRDTVCSFIYGASYATETRPAKVVLWDAKTLVCEASGRKPYVDILLKNDTAYYTVLPFRPVSSAALNLARPADLKMDEAPSLYLAEVSNHTTKMVWTGAGEATVPCGSGQYVCRVTVTAGVEGSPVLEENFTEQCSPPPSPSSLDTTPEGSSVSVVVPVAVTLGVVVLAVVTVVVVVWFRRRQSRHTQNTDESPEHEKISLA